MTLKSLSKLLFVFCLGLFSFQIQATNIDQPSVNTQFDEAAEIVAKIKDIETTLNREVIGQLYGLYKQATIGNCNIPQPPAFHFMKKMKYAEWKKQNGKSKQQAMKEYIQLVRTNIK